VVNDMKTKNHNEMNLYDVMNVSHSASQQDIEKAYRKALIYYEKNSMAHYTLMDEDQRRQILNKIKKAYEVLSNPKKRREYDQNIIKQKSKVYHNSYYRSSMERLIIEDGDKGMTKVIKNIKGMFFTAGPNKKK